MAFKNNCYLISNEMHGVVECSRPNRMAVNVISAAQIGEITICNVEFEIREIPGDAGGGWGGVAKGHPKIFLSAKVAKKLGLPRLSPYGTL